MTVIPTLEVEDVWDLTHFDLDAETNECGIAKKDDSTLILFRYGKVRLANAQGDYLGPLPDRDEDFGTANIAYDTTNQLLLVGVGETILRYTLNSGTPVDGLLMPQSTLSPFTDIRGLHVIGNRLYVLNSGADELIWFDNPAFTAQPDLVQKTGAHLISYPGFPGERFNSLTQFRGLLTTLRYVASSDEMDFLIDFVAKPVSITGAGALDEGDPSGIAEFDGTLYMATEAQLVRLKSPSLGNRAGFNLKSRFQGYLAQTHDNQTLVGRLQAIQGGYREKD